MGCNAFYALNGVVPQRSPNRLGCLFCFFLARTNNFSTEIFSHAAGAPTTQLLRGETGCLRSQERAKMPSPRVWRVYEPGPFEE